MVLKRLFLIRFLAIIVLGNSLLPLVWSTSAQINPRVALLCTSQGWVKIKLDDETQNRQAQQPHCPLCIVLDDIVNISHPNTASYLVANYHPFFLHFGIFVALRADFLAFLQMRAPPTFSV